MKYLKERLPINGKLRRKLELSCKFNKARVEFISGIIFRIEDTNISYIEPHRFIIKVKGIALEILCYDNLNLYLYDRTHPIQIVELVKLIKVIEGD